MESVKIEGGWLVRLEVGERLPAALADFCRGRGLASATAEGLGAIRDVELGYFDVERKAYDRTRLEGSWELLNLWADVAEYDGELFAHTVLCVLSRDDPGGRPS